MRRRWLTAGGAGSAAALAVLLVVLSSSGGAAPAHLSSIDPDVVVQVGPLVTSAPAVAASNPVLPSGPPEGWVPMAAPPPAPPPPPVPAPLAAAATSPEQAVANAYLEGVAPGRFSRVAVALYDRQTGQFYGAGDIDTGYRAASVVKVLIAARLLRGGRTDGRPLTSDDYAKMWRMIVCSDNDAAEFLWWNRAGGPDGVITWVRNTYGITGIWKSERPGAWGTTFITARGMVQFYATVFGDPVIRDWLAMFAMPSAAHYGGCGSGGFDQWFGLPSAAQTWAVKQGWVCCWSNPAESQTRLHSTGYVDGYRYVAVLLTEGPTALYNGAGRSIVTAMARALLPGGHGPSGGPNLPQPSHTVPEPPRTEDAHPVPTGVNFPPVETERPRPIPSGPVSG